MKGERRLRVAFCTEWSGKASQRSRHLSKGLHEVREQAGRIFASSVFHAVGNACTQVLRQKWSWWVPEISGRLKRNECYNDVRKEVRGQIS